jgi:phage tail-like protein
MAQFSVNATRFDPYKNFKFRVKWDGRYVAGISKVGGSSGRPRSSSTATAGTRRVVASLLGEASTTRSSSIAGDTTSTSSSGPTRSGTRSGLGAEVSLKDFRKDIIIEVYNEAGQLALAYKVFRCWVLRWQAMPDLDANANAVAIQHIKLENEGWERDYDVPEPSEPQFTEPAA